MIEQNSKELKYVRKKKQFQMQLLAHRQKMRLKSLIAIDVVS